MAIGSKNDYHLKNFYTGIITQDPVLFKYQFIVTFGGADIESYGFCDQSAAGKNLTYYVQSANLPGVSLKNGTTTFLGTEFRIPGVKEFKHTWSVKMLLNQNLFAYKALQAWHRDISRLELDGGGIKHVQNAYAKVNLLASDSKTITNTYVLEGIWIKSLSNLDLKYTNGGENPMQLTCDFRYQYSYEEALGDPLAAGNAH